MSGPLIAAAGFAEASPEAQREFALILFGLTLIPAILYCSAVFAVCVFVIRKDVARGKLSPRSWIVLLGLSFVVFRISQTVI